MRRFLNNKLSNYNNVGDKVDDFCEDCENRWLPFSRVWWDSTEKNIANIKRKDNGIFVIKKILSLINSISESIKDIYDRLNTVKPLEISEDKVILKNDYIEIGVTKEDFQEDLNITFYENYINLKNTKVDKPTTDGTVVSHPNIVGVDNLGNSAKLKASEFGKVDTVNNKQPTSDKNISLGIDDILPKGMPLTSTTDSTKKIIAYDDTGKTYWTTVGEVSKVKSVNSKTGEVVLKTSDLQNDSDYTTNAILTAHTNDKANPHNVTKEQIGLGNVDNTSDLNKPISIATQTELSKKVNKPTTNATNEYVILADGSTAPKSDFGKVDTIDGIEADENKDVKLGAVRKSESNEVEAGFDLHQKDGASIGVGANGLKVFKGGITATFGTTSIYVDNLVPEAAYKFQEILFPKRAVKNVEEKVYPVTYIQGVKADETGRVDVSGIPWNYTSSNIRYSGILDKSADATYNLFPVLDSNKNLAYADNPYQMMKNGFSLLTQSQALELGQLLNGGIGSSGMMSVNMISPPYIKLADEDTYVVLRGANLYLQVDNYRIDITDINGSILANIPNSNIQLRASGTELVFYFNFSSLGQGKYKLKLTSGSKVLQTTLSFEVVQNMEIVNLNGLTWEVLEKNGNQVSASVISPTAITLNRLVNDTSTYLPTISAKSSPIFQAHEDWMLEFEVTFRMNLGSGTNGLSKTIAGVDYEAVQHTLIQSGIAYIYWNKAGSAGHISRANYFESPSTFIGFTEGTGGSGSSHDHIKTLNVILVKTGNMITINTEGYTSTNIVTNGEAYCFLAQISGRQQTNSESLSVKLLTAYKF